MQVRVQNLNIHPYREKFRDYDIEIPAGGELLMDYDEADAFLQTYRAPVKDGQGRPDPLYFKKLRIHPEDKARIIEQAAGNELVCHASGGKAGSLEELNKMLKNYTHLLADKDAAVEGERVKATDTLEMLKKENQLLKRENKEYKSRIELIEERLGLRGEQEPVA